MKISNEWKQSLNTKIDEFRPFSLKVPLFDLLFYKEDGVNKPRVGGEEVQGLKLEHNCIVSYDKLYEDANDAKKLQNVESAIYERFSFDLACPDFDIRNRPQFLHHGNSEKVLKTQLTAAVFNQIVEQLFPQKLKENDYYYPLQKTFAKEYAPGFKVFEKDAALNLSSTESFLKTGYGAQLKITYQSDYDVKDYEDYGLILCDRDFKFESRFLTHDVEEFDKLKSFTSVALNPFSEIPWSIFKEYYGLQIGSSAPKNFFKYVDGAAEISPIIEYLLKNCFVLLKCSFFGDYVDYQDFGQKLSKSANVIHDNLILSSNADFNKYDEFSDDVVDSSKKTRPYIPTTIPSIDRYTNEVLEAAGIDYTSLTTEEKVQNLIDLSTDPSTLIGSLPTESFEALSKDEGKTFTSNELNDGNAALWFDPNSRNSADDYEDVPTLMTKHGNLLVDGRVISRTIDEIWEAIKRLQSGRKPDSLKNDENEIGYPYGEDASLKTNTDTRPVVKTVKFQQNGSTYYGDPVYVQHDDGSLRLSFEVKEWVNNPDKILYNLSDAVKQIFTDNFSTLSALSTTSDILKVLKTKPTEYLPSETPYSLRELESLLRGLQYNLTVLAIFSKEYGVTVGALGKIVASRTWKENAGSAYQLHRDFKNDGSVDTTYQGTESLGKIDAKVFNKDQDRVSSQSVFMSAAGTWQSVGQFMRLRVKEEEF